MAKKAARKIKVDMTRKNASKKVERVKALMEDTAKMQKRRDFINKFVLCEIVCKHIVEAYKRHQKDLKPGEYITLDMRHIPAAMTLYRYSIPKHVLSDVFGSGKKRGQKSAKKLRDGIMHAMNDDDLNEVIEREEFLYGRMGEFLSYFQ